MRKWSVTSACGGRFPSIEPVFLNDKNRIAVATALAIKVYQLSTKQMSAKISLDLTDASQLKLSNSENEFLVVRKNGSVDSADVQDGSVKKLYAEGTIKVKRLVQELGQGRHLALVTNQKGMYEIGELDFNTEGSFQRFHESAVAHVDSGLVQVSNKARYAAFMHHKSGKTELVNLATREAHQLAGASRSTPVSLAVSDSGLIAVGNASGVIDLVYPTDGAIRALKWHLEPVQSLKFSQNDEYLLSGGSEKVLVFWQLATNRQQFLPRLDGTITSIVVNKDNTLYGLTLNDAQLVVISAVDLVSRLHVAGTKADFVKLPPEHQVARRRRRKRAELDMWANIDYTTPLSIHPGTRNAYLLSNACQAQVYSLNRDDQEATITLARTLDTGKVRHELEIQDPQVDILRFTANGEFMITVDTYQTPAGLLSSMDREVNLKFWALTDGKWSVVTRVASPHGNFVGGSSLSTTITGNNDPKAGLAGDIEIRDIVATDDSVITAGSDGSLRVWRLDAGERTWHLRQIMPAFAAHTRHVSVAISADHSVLALAHDAMIYLVDAKRLKIAKQLSNIAGSSIRSLLFVRSNIAALSRSRLVIFDLVSMSERWAIALKTPSHGGRLIAADPVLGKIALAVNYWTPQYRVNSRVVLFDSNKSPIPEGSYVHPFAIGSLTLIPGTSSYCFIDQRGVLCTLAGTGTQRPRDLEPAEPLQTTLVSLYQNRQAASKAAQDLKLDGHKKSLDVNSVSRLFESDASLDQLFDQVLRLVS